MSKSYSDKYSDKQLLSLEQRLFNLFNEAYKESKQDALNYWNGYDEVINGKIIHHKGFAERYQQELDAKIEGTYSDLEWQQWIESQLGRGKRLDSMADAIADRLAKTSETASAYINDTSLNIYRECSNFEAFQIEKAYNGAISFDLVDDKALKAIAKGNQVEFNSRWKATGTNPREVYAWNRAKVENELFQGLLRGEGIGEIATRIQKVTNSTRATAIRNARTSACSAQSAGRQDTFEKAAAMGIEVIKEWKSHHDATTRDSHAHLDGIRVKYDEKFPNGLMYPADPSGEPSEVYNCRCAMGRVKSDTEKRTDNDVESYNEWKSGKQKTNDIESNKQVLKPEVRKFIMRLDSAGIYFNEVSIRTVARTENEIIEIVAGGDRTSGSCASVGLAYAGQKFGLDVLDFRDGASRNFFSGKKEKLDMFDALGIKYETFGTYKSNLANGKRAIESMEVGKEYYLSVGRHAAIVKMHDTGFSKVPMYLELQSTNDSGWHYFDSDVAETLRNRFGCVSSSHGYKYAYLTDISQFEGNEGFSKILGYINTSENKQKKGKGGSVK